MRTSILLFFLAVLIPSFHASAKNDGLDGQPNQVEKFQYQNGYPQDCGCVGEATAYGPHREDLTELPDNMLKSMEKQAMIGAERNWVIKCHLKKVNLNRRAYTRLFNSWKVRQIIKRYHFTFQPKNEDDAAKYTYMACGKKR